MVNVKFQVGNNILKIANWYALIRTCINLIAGTVFVVLSYALTKDGKIIWPYFWAGLSFYFEVLLIWVFKHFLYGFGLMVCDSAYSLSQKRAVTYLDYKEAKRLHSNRQLNDEEFEKIENEYAKNDNGFID